MAFPVFIGAPIFGGESYNEKVLATAAANLIAFWPLNDLSGSVADNLEGTAARDGAYTGVTLGQTGIGDGDTCPLFDGINDKVNVYSASLATAWSGIEGTFTCWLNPSTVAGGGNDAALHFEKDGNNYARIHRAEAGLVFELFSGADQAYISAGSVLSADTWYHVAMSWSESGNAVKAFIGGAQTGSTQAYPNTWSGTLGSTTTTIGAYGSSLYWAGRLAKAAVWTTPLTAAQISALASL
jgi:hypothetical protein